SAWRTCVRIASAMSVNSASSSTCPPSSRDTYGRSCWRRARPARCGPPAPLPLVSRGLGKAFPHSGPDIPEEGHVLEAGLGFFVKTEKASGRFGEFIGRQAVLRARDLGGRRRLLQFKLEDPEPLLFHNEPVLRDGRVVGFLTSGGYGHALGAAIGLGYVPCRADESAENLL